jgi:hypothetical protein
MKYVANPVMVDAYKVLEVSEMDKDGAVRVRLDGQGGAPTDAEGWHKADSGMCARYRPKEGDYWVVQADGYIYLNPKDVFERKYTPYEMTQESAA